MKHITFIKILFVLIIFVTCYTLHVTLVSAQQISLSLSPHLTEVAIKPGQSLSLNYKLNNSGDPVVVTIQVLPIESQDIYGNIEVQSSSQSPISFTIESGDITLDTPFFLKNDDSVNFSLNIFVPEETPPKDYYFSLLAQTQAPPIEEGATNIRAKTSLASNLLITVTKTGEVDLKPKITLFEVLPPRKINILGLKVNLFNSFEKVPVVLVVGNSGKNLIKPQGEMVLRGPLWQTKKYLITRQNVLAESQRLISVDSSNLQAPTSNSLLLPGFLLGNYKLSTSISFGQGSPTLYASTSFFVLPVKFTIAATAVFIMVLFLIYLKQIRS